MNISELSDLFMPKILSSKTERESKDLPRHKKPIQFRVDNIPFEFLNGEEESRSVFVSKHINAKGEKIILRRDHHHTVKRAVIQPHIMPWSQLKKVITRDYLRIPYMAKQKDDGESVPMPDYFDNLINLNSGPYPITVPYGFQILKKMKRVKTQFRDVFYLQSSNTFAALDTHAFNFWKSNNRVMEIPLIRTGANGTNQNLTGITIWTYIDQYQINVVAMKNLQIKILDSHFMELSSTLTSKPILCFEFSSRKNELITGEVGSIKFWTIKVKKINSKLSYSLEQRFEINDFSQGEWINCLKYDPSFNRLFVGCDNSLRVYEYESGDLFETIRNVHDLSFTCLEYYEPSECIITAGKDGCIKIWNRNRLVYNFTEHFNAVTAIALMEEACHALPGSMPLLLSSSLDGTVRMWNFDTGQCLQRYLFWSKS